MSKRDARSDPQNGDIFLGEGGFRSIVPHVTGNRKTICCVKDCLDDKSGLKSGDKLVVLEYEREAFLRWAKTAMVYRDRSAK